MNVSLKAAGFAIASYSGLLGLACGKPDAAVRVADATEIAVLEQSPDIHGRDGGFSTQLWGRSVWVYGDTVLDREDELGRSWLHNSYSFTTDTNAGDGITQFEESYDTVGSPRMLIEPTPEELAFNLEHLITNCSSEPCGARYGAWPVEPVWDEANDRALVFFNLIYAEPGAWNFESVGSGIAEWTAFDTAPQRLDAGAAGEHPELGWGADDPVPDQGPHIIDGFLYGFACPLRGLERPCKLGRAPLETVAQRTSWRWYDGNAWRKDYAKGKVLFRGNVAMTVSFNEYLQKWTVLYAQPFEDRIRMRTAPSLTGPWSKAATLFVGNDGDDERWIYDAVAHPDFEEEGGRILYVTFSREVPGVFGGAELPIVRVELD